MPREGDHEGRPYEDASRVTRLFEGSVVDEELDAVWPRQRVIAEGELHRGRFEILHAGGRDLRTFVGGV
jgi:hypothetical protein